MKYLTLCFDYRTLLKFEKLTGKWVISRFNRLSMFQINVNSAAFKRPTFHMPNQMQISLNKDFCSLTVDWATGAWLPNTNSYSKSLLLSLLLHMYMSMCKVKS